MINDKIYTPVSFPFLVIIACVLSCCSSVEERKVQWEPFNLDFALNERYHYRDFPFQLNITHEESNTVYTLDPFWTGGNSWTVRMVLTEPGSWKWEVQSDDPSINKSMGEFLCIPPPEDLIESNANYKGKIKVIDGNHYFHYADNTPVLLLAEQLWDFNLASWFTVFPDSTLNIQRYLEDRKSKGFNVAQMRFMRTSDANEGGLPFPLYNKEKPGSLFDSLNTKYFSFLDERFQQCFDNGFVVAGHPEWIGSAFKINHEEAQWLERFFLARYGAYNLIYSISGEFDKNFHKQHRHKEGIAGIWNSPKSDTMNMKLDTKPWKALGSFVSKHNSYHTPISIHPGWHQPRISSSGDYLHDESWFDHSWIQTYKQVFAVPKEVREDYNRSPVKPVFFSEGIREGDQTDEIGVGAYGIRWEVWQALLNGAAAHTYRHYGIYLNSRYEEGIAGPWTENLDSEGAFQAGIAVEILRSLDWTNLKPATETIKLDGEPIQYPDTASSAVLNRVPAMSSNAGKLYCLYIPKNNQKSKITVEDMV